MNPSLRNLSDFHNLALGKECNRRERWGPVTRMRDERKDFARFALDQLKTCRNCQMLDIMSCFCAIFEITVSNVTRLIKSDIVSSTILVTQCLLNVNFGN